MQQWMTRFNAWFSSAAGVIQVTAVVCGWVLLEQIFPRWDPNGFLLLYVLTVWSAVTQNLLAYGSAQAAREAEKVTAFQSRLLQNQADTMAAMQALLQRLEAQIEDIAEEVETDD